MPRFGTYLLGAALLATAAFGQNRQQSKNRVEFPEAPGRETAQKLCGTCHGAEVVITLGLSRAGWSQVIGRMVTRGAKGTPEEFGTVLDYLTTNFPPGRTAAPTSTPVRSRAPGIGALDQHIVDVAAADRGRKTYIANCISCHGPKARGNENGPDLVRSVTVLHDRYGSTIGPFLKAGHPMQSKRNSASLTKAEVEDLSHFLHQRVGDTLRSGPYSEVLNVLTGDAKAGEAFFNGAGGCNSCHSPSGDLAHIAGKYDPPTLQQRFVFPQAMNFSRRRAGGSGGPGPRPVTATVTPPSGPAASGVLLNLDDFNVALRDAEGEYHSWKRTPGLRIEKQDPYAAHVALLETMTDKNIHDVVAYLETLK